LRDRILRASSRPLIADQIPWSLEQVDVSYQQAGTPRRSRHYEAGRTLVAGLPCTRGIARHTIGSKDVIGRPQLTGIDREVRIERTVYDTK
jgi:hypothetical protein